MRHVLRSFALISAIGITAAAHATTYSATVALNDLSTNDITFTLAGGTPVSFTTSPTVDTLTIQESSSLTPASSSINESDSLSLVISFTSPGTGTGTISGLGSISGTVNKADGTIHWNSTSTTVTLSDGSVVQATIAPQDVIFPPKSNVSGNGQNTITAQDALTFTVLKTAATPEPSSLALLGTGVLGIAGMVRRRING